MHVCIHNINLNISPSIIIESFAHFKGDIYRGSLETLSQSPKYVYYNYYIELKLSRTHSI